jgi:hypothetical protein
MPTLPGVPVDPTIATTISAAGGTVATADGALRVSVPAGTVAAATAFTITPIANTARGAVGGAFRLGPEGTRFTQPVTLTFKGPESYGRGTSLAGVGVSYQDARGYWQRVEPVTRDAAANTISVQTDHFSDWALTWELGVAAAEGPIFLDQGVGAPFTAHGRATVFFQGDDEHDTTYVLTGTLELDDGTVTMGDEVCVPDQLVKALPPNVAEIHKGFPAVFRWGLAVHWSLTCTAPGGGVTTRLLPTQFDTMFIALTRCPGLYDAGQIADPAHMLGAYTSDCGAEGRVTATWDLRACIAGAACQVAGDCRLGEVVCTDGIGSCVDAGPAPNGTACGPGEAFVCSEQQCVDPADQQAGFTVTPIAGLTTTEAGGIATFDVVLNKAPTTTVTVAVSTARPRRPSGRPASPSRRRTGAPSRR